MEYQFGKIKPIDNLQNHTASGPLMNMFWLRQKNGCMRNSNHVSNKIIYSTKKLNSIQTEAFHIKGGNFNNYNFREGALLNLGMRSSRKRSNISSQSSFCLYALLIILHICYSKNSIIRQLGLKKIGRSGWLHFAGKYELKLENKCLKPWSQYISGYPRSIPHYVNTPFKGMQS